MAEVPTGSDPGESLRNAVALLSQGASAPLDSESLANLNTLVETHQKAFEMNGARQERREIRQVRLAITGAAALVGLLLGLVLLSEGAARAKLIDQVAAALLAAVPTAAAAFFAGKNAAKKD